MKASRNTWRHRRVNLLAGCTAYDRTKDQFTDSRW